jgi:F1F0 ATPase subunit 2
MSEIILLILSFAGGMALGAFYFMNLWRTVKKLTDDNSRDSGFVLDFFVRTGVVLAGFYIIMSGRWERMALAIFGFIVMREIIKRVIGRCRETA